MPVTLRYAVYIGTLSCLQNPLDEEKIGTYAKDTADSNDLKSPNRVSNSVFITMKCVVYSPVTLWSIKI
jgi:hypothetical protein